MLVAGYFFLEQSKTKNNVLMPINASAPGAKCDTKKPMSRIVLGNSGSALALQQTRTVLSELTDEWPDLNITQRTIRGASSPQEVLDALLADKMSIAVLGADDLPPTLPDELAIAAITKRLEPRTAVVSKGHKNLADLASGDVIGVSSERDRTFILAHTKHLDVQVFAGGFDEHFNRISTGELAALVLPAATLIRLGHRQHIEVLLDVDAFTPSVGQGALALVVRSDDDVGFDTAYTLQHRPSFDRVRAERSFASAFADASYAVGALATVSPDGELSLFGAVASTDSDLLIQAEISGEAREAEDLGKELAQDVLGQLNAR